MSWLLTLALAPLALSQDGAGALLYTGGDGYTDETPDALVASLAAMGADPVLVSDNWPSKLNDYQLVVMFSNEDDLEKDQSAALQAFSAAGGSLVLGVEPANDDAVDVFNELLETMKIGTAFVDSSLDAYCSHDATVDGAGDHALVDGISTVIYAYSAEIAATAPGESLLVGESGQTLLAEEGGVVLLADLSLLLDTCADEWTDNEALFANLYDWGCRDVDGDGDLRVSCGGTDCDDTDPALSGLYEEIPDDGIDDDCDGFDAITCYADEDGDGYGAETVVLHEDGTGCLDGGLAEAPNDCDDGDPDAHPGGTEVVDDGIDQDCNGWDAVTCWTDGDGDGYGVEPSVEVTDAACVDYFLAPADGDCDDADETLNPGAEDLPDDGIDQDCDGVDTTEAVYDSGLDEPDDTAGGGDDKGGCGCASSTLEAGPASVAWLGWLAALAAVRRRGA